MPSDEHHISMPKLTVTISNEAGRVTGSYVIDCVDRPGLDSEAYDTLYTIDLIRSAAERDKYLSDFDNVPAFSKDTVSFALSDPRRLLRLNNVNELWLEIQNLMLGARLNFATARMLKELEDHHSGQSSAEVNARFDLHMEKMERFHLAVFEMARIEDLIVRTVYEYFGEPFIEVDTSKPGWEKMLTWDRMKDSLNKRGKPDKGPHPALESMSDHDYEKLMSTIRSYRSADVVALTGYRDIRTHRVAPSVDHPELAVDVSPVTYGRPGQAIPLFGRRIAPEYQFLDLYAQAKRAYSQLIALLGRLNEVIHA